MWDTWVIKWWSSVLQLYHSKKDADCFAALLQQGRCGLPSTISSLWYLIPIRKAKTNGGVTEPFLYYDANGSSGTSQSTLSN